MADDDEEFIDGQSTGQVEAARSLLEAEAMLDAQRRLLAELFVELEALARGVPSLKQEEILDGSVPFADLRSRLSGAVEQIVRRRGGPALATKLTQMLDRFLFREALESPAMGGSFVVWRNKKGARKHHVVVPSPEDPVRSWRDFARGALTGIVGRRRVTLVACPELVPVFGGWDVVSLNSLDELVRDGHKDSEVTMLGGRSLRATGSRPGILKELEERVRLGNALGIWVFGAEDCVDELATASNVSGVKVVVASELEAELCCLKAPTVLDCTEVLRTQPAGAAPALPQTELTETSALIEDHVARRYQRELHGLDAARARLGAGLGIAPIVEQSPLVSVLCVSHRPEMLRNCIETFRRQTYQRKELILVANADRVDRDLLSSTLSDANITILRTNGDMSLGQSLNRARLVARGDLWAKMDDDDLYGANYLRDAVLTLREQDAAIVGKGTYYRFIEETQRLYLTSETGENAVSDRFVHGGTIVAHRTRLLAVDFLPVQRGTDTLFLQQSKLLGLKIYSGDRFNFCYVRYARPGHHTFDVGSAAYLKDSTLAAEFLDKSLIEV